MYFFNLLLLVLLLLFFSLVLLLFVVGVLYLLLLLFTVLIDDIHDATSRADQKIKRQTRRVNEVRKKESCKCTCCE